MFRFRLRHGPWLDQGHQEVTERETKRETECMCVCVKACEGVGFMEADKQEYQRGPGKELRER